MTVNVLIVDDDPIILEGLRQGLQGQAQDWDIRFVSSGANALMELEKGAFDVVISDLHMPKMDGVTLLSRIQDRYPRMIRVLMTGACETQEAFRASAVAHQFFSKSSPPSVLREIVHRSAHLHLFLENEKLRTLVGGLGSLPPLPHIYLALSRALADPTTSLKGISEIVEGDMALCARLLQIVNSAYFGIPRHISNIHGAISFLGTVLIRNLTLSIEVFRGFSGLDERFFSLESLQNHALLTANIAMPLLADKYQAEDAFAAGMLHDIGKLILASRMPGPFGKVLRFSGDNRCGLYRAEQEVLGTTHAEVGATLLRLWGLPDAIVEAVAFHHHPQSVDQQDFDVLGAVYVANILAHQYGEPAPGPKEFREECDLVYLRRLRMDRQLPAWRDFVESRFASHADNPKR